MTEHSRLVYKVEARGGRCEPFHPAEDDDINIPIQVASFGDYFADRVRDSSTTKTFGVLKPSAASSSPLSHNQQDPLKPAKPRVWEIRNSRQTQGATSELGPTMTRTKGDSTQDQRASETQTLTTSDETNKVKMRADASSPRKRHGMTASVESSGVETLTYRDPFAGVYKKYVRVIHALMVVPEIESLTYVVGISSRRMESIFSVA